MSGPDIEARLRAICAELELAASDAQVGSLHRYLLLLQRWNAVYNLTAVRDPEQMLTQHLADCLAIVGPLQRHLGAREARLLDVGSGAGLPGIILAVMLPQLQVCCVDAVGKKAAFIQQAAGELRLKNVAAAHARVESLRLPAFDVIASRAFAALGDFIISAQGSLKPAGVFLAMKGKRPDEREEAALPTGWRVFHVEQLAPPGLDAERHLVWIKRSDASSAQRAASGDV